MNFTSLKDAAVYYATDLGWKVFPLKPGGKDPLTPNGHKDATNDTVQVEAYWDKYPDANIGLACSDSGLIVIDLDRHEGKPDPIRLSFMSV